MCYLIDYIGTLMSANVDQFIIIFDMADFGYKNFSLDMWKACIEVSGVSQHFNLIDFFRHYIRKEFTEHGS